MPFNQEALKTMHKLAEKEGYSGDESQLQELLSTDKDALDVMFKLARREGYNQDVSMFSDLLGVKKKAESDSSLDISAGPYASGQKPKGFGDIVSEKISEVSPQEDNVSRGVRMFGQKLENFSKEHEAEMAVAGFEGRKEQSKKLDTRTGALVSGTKQLASLLVKFPQNVDNVRVVLNKSLSDKLGYEMNALDKVAYSNIQSNLHQGTDLTRDLDKQAQERNKFIEDYDTYKGSIIEAVKKRDYTHAIDKASKAFLQSLPVSLAYMNAISGTAVMASTIGDEISSARDEGRNIDETTILAGGIKASAEFALNALLGTGKLTKNLIKELGKKGAEGVVKDITGKFIRKSLGRKIAEGVIEEPSEEIVTQIIQNAVDIHLNGSKKGYFDGIEDAGLVGLFGAGTQGTLMATLQHKLEENRLKKAESEQAKEGTPTVSEEQQAQLNLSKPNKPELPPDAGGGGDLMSPEGMQQAGVEPQQPTFEDVMSYSQNQGDSPNADADNIDLTQLVKAKEVVQKIIDNDGVATSIDGTPVDIQELNEQGDVILQDGNIVSMSDITVHSELGDNPLVDVVNAELENEQQVPDSQQQAQPTELPKKIFHATKASFEGLPSRQEQSKVSAFGTEPAGTFYSTNPDKAKQAIGDGGDARVIEADFNPKNPLVIENTDNEVYVNTKNESEQQAIEELFDEYAEQGVDLTEQAADDNLPEKVNKRTTEIFADKLKEQGYDAVINNDNGDVIVLDDAIVTEKKAETKVSPTNEAEKSQQIQELKDELDALDAQDDSKLTEKEKKRIKNAIRHTVTSIARGYFLDGGKILWDSLKKETGFKGGEFKDFLGIVSKTGRTVDGIANSLWENRDNDKFDSGDFKNAIIEVLSEPRDEWYINQRREVDSSDSQNILEQKQRIQEQIDILEDADLSFEDIKNELEANEAMWQQKFEQEGHPKQKSSTFVNKELDSDIPKAIEYLAKMKELEDGTKKRNMQGRIDEITAKDPKLKKIIENFDIILKQLNYTSDC